MLNQGQISPIDVAETPVPQTTGLIESFKNAMQPETIAHKLGIDKNMLIDIGIYGAIGFITGFLLKKYSEYFIAAALLLIGVAILQQFDYVAVSFNMQKIHGMLGFPYIPMVSIGYGQLLLEWTKSNIPAVTSLVVGFLVGLKIG